MQEFKCRLTEVVRLHTNENGKAHTKDLMMARAAIMIVSSPGNLQIAGIALPVFLPCISHTGCFLACIGLAVASFASDVVCSKKYY
jgi:hypothetical protein